MDISGRLQQNKGLIIAVIIILLWLASCITLLSAAPSATALAVPLILIQTHLYTGLFITAHDAMHHSVSSNRKANRWIGRTAAMLFAFNNYKRLNRKHHEHHKYSTSEKDPDYHKGSFITWYLKFLSQYISIWQILWMAITYNLLTLIFSEANIILYWVIPAVLSTFQLFFFGTFLPHRKKYHGTNRHHAGSQQKNHLLAFLSCYFFGYHYEHHQFPHLPWWRLYKVK